MNRTALAMALAVIGTLAWLAIFANLIPEQIGWLIAVGAYMLSGLAWWIPLGKNGDQDKS